jgi:hypothetical protein
MQVEAHRSDRGRDHDEEQYAQMHGRVLHPSGRKGRASRARLILYALGLIITLAVAAFAV